LTAGQSARYSAGMLNISPRPLVIYHGGCPDGACAAACALYVFPDAECVPALHGDPPPVVDGRDVLVVDFSYPRRTLLELAASARSLLVLDHHQSAARDLGGLEFAEFDMGRSGAGMTWDRLVGGPRPWIVDYVEDRDLWKYSLHKSREVGAWLLSIGVLPQDFLPLMSPVTSAQLHLGEDAFSRAVSGGTAILAFQNEWCRQVAATAEVGVLGDVEVPVVNAPHPLGSQVLEYLYAGRPFSARWQRRGDGLYQYSVASDTRDGVDVSVVASMYGGGGHRHAAGFVVDRLVHVVVG